MHIVAICIYAYPCYCWLCTLQITEISNIFYDSLKPLLPLALIEFAPCCCWFTPPMVCYVRSFATISTNIIQYLTIINHT